MTSSVIASSTNPLVKKLTSLSRKKGRAETGLFLAEGARLVEQGLARDWRLDTLLISASMVDRPHLDALAARANATGARVVSVADRLMSKITRKENAQSVLAAFHQRHWSLDDLAKTLPAKASLYVALYEVRDPGNLGTILRTLDCAGASGVVLVGSCCDPYSFEAVRASMGSVFDVPFTTASFPDLDAWRKDLGLSMTAASMNGCIRYDRFDLTGASLLLMGNEQAGLPPAVEAACDALVQIPMRGGADSLNLAQATAIMVYEAWRQRDFR